MKTICWSRRTDSLRLINNQFIYVRFQPMTKLNFRFETLTIIFAALTFFSFSALGNSFNESRDALTTEVLISTDDVNIGGTLLVPKQLQSTALVVFISGVVGKTEIILFMVSPCSRLLLNT